MKDDLLCTHPCLAPDIFHAFAEAKRLYVRRLAEDETPSSGDDAVFRQVTDITGDPLPYGIEPNRRMLDAVIQHALEQGILSRPVAVEDLFHASTHGLTTWRSGRSPSRASAD